jgi:hypothetical protein
MELLQQEIADNLNETNGTSKMIYPANGSNTRINQKDLYKGNG